MEKTTCMFLLSTLLLSCLMVHCHRTRQSDALNHLYKAKLNINSSIRKSRFTVIPHEHKKKILPQKGLKEQDRIQKLPGQPPVGFKQYGGYITIDASAGSAFYYYFVEAQKSKKALPLLLWLNGGPGCSSLGFGAFEEIGPFRIESDGKTLFKNKYAWNNAANVLFLESPAGVGFSYSNTTREFKKSGDTKTAMNNYIFLLNWFERFPEYINRKFYIAGESYAGHSVPQLAHTILYHNKKANKTIINLKGIMVGNAVINEETDNKGRFDYLATHAIISRITSEKIHKYCDFSSDFSTSYQCIVALSEADDMKGNIDSYNIYAPLCFSNVSNKPKRHSIMDFDPCTDKYVHNYLNLPEVQEALHANITKISYSDWQACSHVLDWVDSTITLLPLLKEFIENGLRVWIYSGDIDGVVPVTSTQYSIEAMKLPTLSTWRPWFLNKEVGGYTQDYKYNLTFATIRGAGHEVPSYHPDRAFSLVLYFLAGTPLPYR